MSSNSYFSDFLVSQLNDNQRQVFDGRGWDDTKEESYANATELSLWLEEVENDGQQLVG